MSIDHATALARLRQLAEPYIETLGLSLWGLEIVGTGRPTVRIFLDSPKGVDVEHCATVSRQVGLALDVEDLFPGRYDLEVSSPGFNRRFFEVSQLPPYQGRELDITLAEPVDGRKRFRGVLSALEGDVLVLNHEGRTSHLPWGEVAKAKLVHVFPEPSRG
jgi:ribosome maturation factor RimP